MVRRRPAAAAPVAMAAALFAVPEVASGAQAADQALVRVATVSLEAGKASTVAVFGQLTSVKAALLTDDLSPPAAGRSKVRLIQAIPGESAVGLVGGGDVLVPDARFPSASDYQEVPAGPVDAEVRKTGGGEVLARADNLKLPSGSISSLVAAAGYVVQQRRSSG
jgi:hypothetical protein